ncbi:hypothetical protein ACJ72_04924 [Emergomyces africanus]|uniref:Uncharacterized protein n=1 Tax=Emergomyces africanus TaxID=1955775 RepID=A0A1B7NVE4_9EURO|nr:hypothetical protein ACJ72_04924 [Emergomyces africanus]
MDISPRNPPPDSGSLYEETNPVLRSSFTYEMFPRSTPDTGTKRSNDSNDPVTDSDPEYNLHDESGWSRPPAHRSGRISEPLDSVELGVTHSSHNHTASAFVYTQPLPPPRRFCATDSGSPVHPPWACKKGRGSLTPEHKRHRHLNYWGFEIYTDPNFDAEAEADELSKIPSKQQQLPPTGLLLIDENNKLNPHLGTNDDGKDRENNKENIPPETPAIPLREGGPRLRRRNRHRQPLGFLNPSDFYPVDASMYPQFSGKGIKAVTRNLQINGDDGDVFLGSSGGRGVNWDQLRCSTF